jgi:dihydroneopterin aldolase
MSLREMTDSVIIEGLAVDTVIGVYDWERNITQRLELDLEMGWDNRRAASSDQVDDALDYARVSEAITELLQRLQPQLLETAAEAVASLLRDQFRVPWLSLTLRKPGAVPSARSVGVRLYRGNGDV